MSALLFLYLFGATACAAITWIACEPSGEPFQYALAAAMTLGVALLRPILLVTFVMAARQW